MARPRKPRRQCVECGKELSTNPNAKRCGDCYFARKGIPSKARPKPTCEVCGKEVSKRAKKCIDCWDNRGSRKEKKEEEKRTYREPLADYEEARRIWSLEIGRKNEKLKKPPKAPKGNRQRYVVLPDVHAPFHQPELIADIIKREKGRASKLICIGDISDSYAFSVFTKQERVPFSYEWGEVTALLATLSENFPEVEIIIGNHDERLEKRLRNHLTEDMIDAVQYMTGGVLCPLTALAKQFENIQIARHEVPGTTHTVDWFTTIGDAWLGHPQKFSRVPGNALRALEDWLLDVEASLGLDRFRLIVLGHTHQLALIPWRGSSMLVECGCVCKTQGYQLSPRLGGRPQKRGYVWFEQEDGVTDLNSVGMHWYYDLEA
jgi:predicted phosphodiesterase